MPIYLMDKAYRITSGGGVAANRVVIHGSATGECTLPTGANSTKIAGVTMHSQMVPGRCVGVRKAGIAEVTAAEPISVGAPVVVAGTTGKVKAITEAPGTKVNCLGFAESASTGDGDLIDVFISIHERLA